MVLGFSIDYDKTNLLPFKNKAKISTGTQTTTHIFYILNNKS
jgi:hypothetical protein